MFFGRKSDFEFIRIKLSTEEAGLVIKVRDVSKDQLIDTLEGIGDHVLDAREV